jgi:hypothetical protein
MSHRCRIIDGVTVAYFTEESLDRLLSIDDIPQLANLRVPPGIYKSARSAKGRPDHIFNPDMDQLNTGYSQLEYVSYPTPSRRHSPATFSEPSPNRPLTWVATFPTDSSRNPPARRWTPDSPESPDDTPDSSLAPLAYLQNCPPLRRHPIDEKTLMLFTASGHI